MPTVLLSFGSGGMLLGRDLDAGAFHPGPEPFRVGDVIHLYDIHLYDGCPDVLRMACSGWALWKTPLPAPAWVYRVGAILPDWRGKPLVVCVNDEVVADPAVAESAVVFFRRCRLVKVGRYDHARGGFGPNDPGEGTVVQPAG